MQFWGEGGFTLYRVETECKVPLGFVVPRSDNVILISSHFFLILFFITLKVK